MTIRNTADLGVLVKDRRIATATTQAELADRAGVGRGFVVRLEQGHPSLEIGRVLAVLEALDLAMEAIDTTATVASRTESESLLNVVFESLEGGEDDR